MSALRVAHPGQPVRLINLDPYAALTPRQNQILDAVRAHNGNRSRAARHLGISVQGVQHVLRAVVRLGVFVPKSDMRGPDLRPRRDRSRKLTPDTVRQIRGSTELTWRLADRFGVSRSAIKDVRAGRRWSSVT